MEWHKYWLEMCKTVALKSKDPSTSVGSVIVRPDNTLCSVGFNGFPRGIKDTYERLHNRDTKYKLTLHAEVNAIYVSNDSDLSQCSLYAYPLKPCVACSLVIIQKNIKRVVVFNSTSQSSPKWVEEWTLSKQLLQEAGVEVLELDGYA